MSGTISYNPYATTFPTDNFDTQSQGGYQGLTFDDETALMWLREGPLASTETLPMWGGVPINRFVNNSAGGAAGMGGAVARATSTATCVGWSTYVQMAHMVVTPGNNAPMIGVNGSVGYFLNGSKARLWVQVDSALMNAANGASVSGLTLYWDTTNYRVTTTSSAGFELPTSYMLDLTNSNSVVASYSSSTKSLTWTSGNAGVLII